MDAAALDLPHRDPRYAPRALEVQQREDGSWLLHNPTPFDGRWTNTLAPLKHWAAQAPDRVWLAERLGEGWRTVTYAEALDAVSRLASAMAYFSVGGEDFGGERLMILAPNGIDHALMTYGAMYNGVAVAPVSPQYAARGADLGRLAHSVDLIRPTAVFCHDAITVEAALALPALRGFPVFATREDGPSISVASALGFGIKDQTSPAPGAVAKLLLTSGSTGRPKAVIQTHGAIAANAAQIAACFDDPDAPVVVNAAPWSHSLGANAILHMVLHRGGTLYIDHGQPVAGRFDETVRNLREIAPTYHNMVPAGWGLFVDHLERDTELARTFFSRVRLLQYGGASMAQSICDRVQAVALATVGERISFATGYGSTETGPTACNIHWPNFTTGMMGLPVPGTTLKLAPVGEKLEARVKGPQISPGYWNAPELTAAAFDEEGFYKLGDAARFADPDRPEAGIAFDGRLVENFKLASGTFVAAGVVRTTAVSACHGAVSDAVVCGEGQTGVGLLLFPNPGWSGADRTAAVREGLARMNAAAGGSAGRVARALLLDDQPDAGSGEVTDKGYINQALARSRRAADIARLFADPAGPGVLTFSQGAA